MFVDPENETIELLERAGTRLFTANDPIEHSALPELRFTVADVFRKPPRPT